ncbi:mucin-2 [Plodia interpunctella]|uniref:mucin-2 n=1 Tax=Plodia interpunctella TaxID=58824 RepID=UPI0023679BE7|nr:serine-rich adhesin for platelets [Plodia interpunctella]
MRAPLCVLLVAACVLANQTNGNEERGTKLPYVADAVGNELPRPSSLPATVGSPVNLLTPDRYEFYTFDESGELVKRLMTLEEIQAIVAAGEEAEGLVTFANENQPTIAFNFSQPPYTKVHNVVTNVQNVLKAQMEAHKNKPHFQPTLDTPDVSDSWSLILPSIFGNTGVDIGPDKIQNTGTFTTPETETIVLDHTNNVDESYLSKEANNNIITSSTVTEEELKSVPITEKINKIEAATIITTTTTITPKPITQRSTTTSTTTTTRRPMTTKKLTTFTRPITTSSTTTKTPPVRVTSSTTKAPSTTRASTITSTPRVSSTTRVQTTTNIPSGIRSKPTTIITSTKKLATTTKNKPTLTTALPKTTSTTLKTTTTTTATPITTTLSSKPTSKTVKPITTQKITEDIVKSNQVHSEPSTTEPSLIQYEKISTFLPVSTLGYVTEKSTSRYTTPVETTDSTTKVSLVSTDYPTSITETKLLPHFIYSTPPTSNFIFILPSTQKPNDEIDREKSNSTTITTQSVSPSTTISSTEFLSSEKVSMQQYVTEKTNAEDVENEPIIPLFDVAQSISQIASDLGNHYRPIPTSSNLLDITKTNSIGLESKENFEIDIPGDSSNNTNEQPLNNATNNNDLNFIKISTLDPHTSNMKNDTEEIIIKDANFNKNITNQFESTTSTVSEKNSTDPFLSESMSDIMSQVVDNSPQTIETSERTSTENIKIITKSETSTDVPNISSTSSVILKSEKENHLSDNKSDISITQEIDKPNKDIENKTIVTTRLQDTNILQDKNISRKQENAQISAINEKNVSSLLIPAILSLEKVSNFNKTQNDNISIIENKINENVVNNYTQTTESPSKANFITHSSTTADKIETTTHVTNAPIRNKFDTADTINKLNKEKIKLPEFQPKIDDFKKKIQKVNIDDKEFAAERNNSWKLISTVIPPKTNDIPKDKIKENSADNSGNKDIVLELSKENQGLEVTSKDLGEDIAQFIELCNELAFRYWNVIIENIDKRRSFVLSPYSITSMLAMIFMGARGATSGEMNEVLKLDDMVTFNPHFTLKNISDSILTSQETGISVSAFIRELYIDKNKGKVLSFYKNRAQQFYNGHVDEIDFNLIGDKIRRRTNLLVKRYTFGKMSEYIKSSTINMEPPLAAFSANIFETDCSGSSVEGRDGEMYFVVSPNVRQRRLVPVPAVVYRNNFLAGYDPILDATAAALGNTNSIVSTLFLMPGQQGNVVHSADLEALEKRILNANPSAPAWNRLLRTLLPRMGLELQIPRFSHKSVFNVSSTLRAMGLKDLFDQEHADLGGLIGPSKDLYLSDMIQSTTFVTCGEGMVAEQHHVEEYPESLEPAARRRSSRWAHDWDEPRDYQRAFHDPHDVGDAMHLPLHLRPRQARLPSRNAQPARLKFDRPFLYFVRHNPSGMILYVGRYNPRLLP